eukprot:783982-Amphidinium_carterae.1
MEHGDCECRKIKLHSNPVPPEFTVSPVFAVVPAQPRVKGSNQPSQTPAFWQPACLYGETTTQGKQQVKQLQKPKRPSRQQLNKEMAKRKLRQFHNQLHPDRLPMKNASLDSKGHDANFIALANMNQQTPNMESQTLND